MDFLARREHSKQELLQKLIKKATSASVEEIEQVLEKLQQDNLLSDKRFTESYLRYRKEKGFGPLHISQELYKKGVSSQTIEAYVDSDEVDWLEILSVLKSKKFLTAEEKEFEPTLEPIKGESKEQNDLALKAKQTRFFQSRGFTLEQIDKVLNE